MQIDALSSALPLSNPASFEARLSKLSPARQRRAVAQQFEAIILRQLLGPTLERLPGAGNDIYGYLLTDAFTQKLCQGGGLGFSRLLERQFTPAGASDSAGHSVSSPAGTTPAPTP